ncbi:MAG TPA: cyclase family protein [Longimicrobiales bacterium]|nr:cyclase family protein [Longimicrobiales bacterium]
MKLIDISQPLGPGTAVWPGDRPVSLEWTMRRRDGDSVNVAALSLSVHAGTHVDGSLHVDDDGVAAGSLPLSAFVGPAVVVDARGRAALDADTLDGVDLAGAPRVLLRTRAASDATTFPQRFAALTPALARRLVALGVPLVGTDAPSVDPVDSTSLDVHRILAAGGVVNVENLVLDDVVPGRYTFIGLPLRLVDADSAPLRAVLVAEREDETITAG